MIGTGTGLEPILFLVFLLLVVIELFSKSISETIIESISPNLSPVPKANRILIFNVLCFLAAEIIFLIWVLLKDLTGLSSSFNSLNPISPFTYLFFLHQRTNALRFLISLLSVERITSLPLSSMYLSITFWVICLELHFPIIRSKWRNVRAAS